MFFTPILLFNICITVIPKFITLYLNLNKIIITNNYFTSHYYCIVHNCIYTYSLFQMLSLSLENFLSKESEFIRDIELHVVNSKVKCEVLEVSAVSSFCLKFLFFVY